MRNWSILILGLVAVIVLIFIIKVMVVDGPLPDPRPFAEDYTDGLNFRKAECDPEET